MLLGRVEPFQGLDEGARLTVVEHGSRRTVDRGQMVFWQDDPGEAMFVLLEGSVKLIVCSRDGELIELHRHVAPAIFGELALLDGGVRSATAEAVEATETLVLRRDAFDRLLDENAAIRRALLTALAGEIRRLTAQLEDLHFLDLPGRLARHLLREIEAAQGPMSTDEVRLPWPYTQGELAGMIGGSRQSVNRLLADLVSRGVLRFEGDELVVPDPRRLAEAAQR